MKVKQKTRWLSVDRQRVLESHCYDSSRKFIVTCDKAIEKKNFMPYYPEFFSLHIFITF